MKTRTYLKYIIVIVIMILLPIGIDAVRAPTDVNGGMLTEDDARQLADNFIDGSATYVFDGIEDTLELVETLYPDIENAWSFVYCFDCRNAGYGDRTGQGLAEVITPHEAVINVEEGSISSATLDGVWDMIHQVMLKG